MLFFFKDSPCDRGSSETPRSLGRTTLFFFFFKFNPHHSLFHHLLFFFFLIWTLNLFIYLWLCWVFVSVRGLSPVAASGGHSSSRCAGLSPSQPLVAEHRLQTRRLSSCGSRTQSLRGMWDLPGPGLEPVSPASAGRLPTNAPPGKPRLVLFIKKNHVFFSNHVL